MVMLLVVVFISLFFGANAQHNVLVILSDDLFNLFDISSLRVEFPNLYSLKEDSIHYSNMFVSAPLCGPSRASLFTGRYNTNFKYVVKDGNGNNEKIGHFDNPDKSHETSVITRATTLSSNEDIVVFQNWLKQHAPQYQIYGTSKLFHNGEMVANGQKLKHDQLYTTRQTKATPKVIFDKYYYHDREAPSLKAGIKRGNRIYAYGSKIAPPYKGKSTDFDSVERMIEMLNQHDKRNPFFAFLGLRKPHSYYHFEDGEHTELSPHALTFIDDLDNLAIFKNQNWKTYMPLSGEFRYKGMPYLYGKKATLKQKPVKLLQRLSKSNKVDQNYRDFGEFTTNIRTLYLRCVKQVDSHVGNIIGKLKQLDQYDNTTIVFLSDHGYQLGNYGRWAKRSLTDGATRIPFLLKPSVLSPPNVYSQRNTTNSTINSIVHTFNMITRNMNVANVTFPSDFRDRGNAVSVTPYCVTPGGKNRFCNTRKFGYSHIGLSLRTGRYRYTQLRTYDTQTHFIDFITIKPFHQELFDVINDPDETMNIIHKVDTSIIHSFEKQLYYELQVCNTMIDKNKCEMSKQCAIVDGNCQLFPPL